MRDVERSEESDLRGKGKVGDSKDRGNRDGGQEVLSRGHWEVEVKRVTVSRLR